MGAGRKLRVLRREEHWADKKYKKAHQGNEWKKPFAGCSHAKGIVLEKMYGGGGCEMEERVRESGETLTPATWWVSAAA